MATISPNLPGQITPSSITTQTSTETLENLEQYYKAQTGVESLEQVVQIIQQLQAAESAQIVQEEPSDPVTTLTSSLIEGLNGIIASLQQTASLTASQSSQISSITQQLNSLQTGLQQSPPQTMSEDELSSLSTDLQTLDVDSSHMSLSDQSQFWSQQDSMFQSLGTQVDQISQLSSLGSSGQNIIEAINTLNSLGAAGAGIPNPSQLASVVNNVTQVLSQLGSYSSSNQQGLLQGLQSLFQGAQFASYQPSTNTAKNYSLVQLVAYSQLSQWASSYLSSYPGTTEDQLQVYLQHKSLSFLSSDSGLQNVLVTNLQNTMSGDLGTSSLAQTLQAIGVQTDSNSIVSVVNKTADPVEQTLENLSIFQVAQPSIAPADSQVVLAQNIITYINQELAPYIPLTEPGTNASLPASVVTDILPALGHLLDIYRGSDPAASSLAGNYLNQENVFFANNGNENTNTFSMLACLYDLIQQARSYAATKTPLTESDLQTYLSNYVNTLNTNDPLALNEYEKNLIQNSGLGVNTLIGGTNDYYSLVQLGTLEGQNVIIPPTIEGNVNLPGTQVQLSTNNAPTLFTGQTANPVNIQQPPSIPSWLTVLGPYQDPLSSLTQSINNAQIAAAVQKALIDKQNSVPLPPPPPAPPPPSPVQTAATNSTQMLQGMASLIQSLYSSGATSHISASNPMLQLAKMLIQGLMSILQSMQSGLPPSSQQATNMLQMMQELNEMYKQTNQNPPQMPSESSFNAIMNDVRSITDHITSLPTSDQQQYVSEQDSLLQNLGGKLTSINAGMQLQQIGTSLSSLSQPPITAAPDPSQLSTIMNSLLGLLPQIGEFANSGATNVSQQLQTLLQNVQFNTFNPQASPQATNYSSEQVLAYAQIMQWVASYLSSHSSVTSSQLQTYLQQSEASYLNTDSDVPLISNFKNTIIQAIGSANFSQTLQSLGVQTNENNILTLPNLATTDPLTQMLSNLSIVQVSQASANLQVDPQIVLAQNAMTYINEQIYPSGQTSTSIPASVFANITPAFLTLIHLARGADPTAALLASQYLNYGQLITNQSSQQQCTSFGALAAYMDLAQAAMQHVATTGPVTVQNLQSYLSSYVSQLPVSSSASILNSYEQNLIQGSGLGVSYLLVSGNVQGQLMDANWSGNSQDPSPFVGMLQLGTVQNGKVDIPQNFSDLFNQSGNQISVPALTSTPLSKMSGLSPVGFPSPTFTQQAISSLDPYQNQMTNLIQQLMSLPVSPAHAVTPDEPVGPVTPNQPVGPQNPATPTTSSSQMFQNLVSMIQILYADGSKSSAGTTNPAIALAKALGQGLMNLVQSLQSQVPQDTPMSNTMVATQEEVQHMDSLLTQNTLPSPQTFGNLLENIQQMNSAVGNLTPMAQGTYWSGQAALLQGMEAQIASLTAGAQLQQVGSSLVSMSQLPVDTAPNLSQLSQNLTTLLETLPAVGGAGTSESLSFVQQAQSLFQNVQFNSFQTQTTPPSASYSLAQMAAYAQITQWSSSYLASNPTATASQLQTYLQGLGSQYLEPSNGLSLVSDIQTSISGALNTSNFQNTLQTIGIQTSASGIVSMPGTDTDPIAQMLSNLNVIQVSQAPSKLDPQVASAQNTITYINRLLSPYYEGGAITGTQIGLPAAILTQIVPALASLAQISRSSDANASNIATQYLNNSPVVFNNPVSQSNDHLAGFAAYCDLAQQAMDYASKNSPVTLQGLQSALNTYVSGFPSTGDASLSAKEANLIQNPGLGVATALVSGQNGQGTLMDANWKGNPNDTDNIFYGLLQLGTSDGGSVQIPQNFSDLSNLTGNQLLSVNTDTDENPLPQAPGVESITPFPDTYDQSSLEMLTNYQSQLSGLMQSVQSVHNEDIANRNAAMPPPKESLQDMFSQIILDHYMPGQEALLESQSNQLNWTNWLGNQYTGLVNDTSGYSSDNSIINFAQKLTNPSASSINFADVPAEFGDFKMGMSYDAGYTLSPPVANVAYQGSAQSAQQSLTQEKTYVTQSMTNAQTAIASIQKILSELTPPGTPETAAFLNNPALASQIQTITSTLRTQLTNLQSTVSNLAALQETLNKITIIPAPSTLSITGRVDGGYGPYTGSAATGWNPSTQFCIEYNPPNNTGDQNTTIVANLSGQESTLINGSSTTPSMSQLAQDINTSSQQTTSQSQTQQMQLQLSMTEIQQEWSVVSSGLQLLNQIMMSFARGISPG
ncbi:MAG: hypothetical protein JSS62_00600 [Verrucomicrobia bacterium]|nr:hypothetical protein [Verrucomicrobiota bacterium]MBS0646632.1 hypothetical protein [Verrucomicrobiota bacterium]